jgi:NRAMP (natural resistance-associated macrophage protein)-like metal ion transporter
MAEVPDDCAPAEEHGNPPANARVRAAPTRLSALARPRGLWLLLASLGPGLIAANAGNDAGGILTYSQVGATAGYSLLWMFPLILVSLAIVQETAARMGAASGKGLSDLIRENFPIHVTVLVLFALLVANGATVISEFIGITAAVRLLFPSHVEVVYVLVPVVALGIWLLVVRGSYASVEKIFLAMTLVFFAYPISAVMAHPDWNAALRHTVHPEMNWHNSTLLFLFVATVGTSITPYMQVYVQSSVADKGITARDYPAQRAEVYFGSLFANVIAVFIVIAMAAALPHHGTLNDVREAALALKPVAGQYAEYLFATGLFGASVLAAAVLPLATAYSIAEALGVEKGLDVDFRQAPVFMSLFTGLMVLGVVVALIPGLPLVQVPILIQVVDCVLLPVILFSMLRLANSRRIMGDMVNGRTYNIVAYATAVVVTVLSVALLAQTVAGWT